MTEKPFSRFGTGRRELRRAHLRAADVANVCRQLQSDDADLVEFLFTVGWRTREVASLAWADLDGKFIRLRDDAWGRWVPVAGAVSDIVARRQIRKRPDLELIFHRKGKPLEASFGDFRRQFRQACEAAGVRPCVVRDLRRSSFIHQVVVLGTDHGTAVRNVGPTTIEDVLRYRQQRGAS